MSDDERPNKSGGGMAVLAVLLLALIVLGMMGIGGLALMWRSTDVEGRYVSYPALIDDGRPNGVTAPLPAPDPDSGSDEDLPGVVEGYRQSTVTPAEKEAD